MPASEAVELETFVGNWRDSLGHHVQVDWARAGNRGGQLDVSLMRERSNRDPIRLNVKRHPDGRFSCGHYDLDTEESRPDHIVWADYRKGRRKSVWTRDCSTVGAVSAGTGNFGGACRDDGRGDHRDRWGDERQRREEDWGARGDPMTGVNCIPVRGWYNRREDEETSSALPGMSELKEWTSEQQPGDASKAVRSQSPTARSRSPGGRCGNDDRLPERRDSGPLPRSGPGSLWSSGPTPGAWVPPTTPPPSAAAGPGETGALGSWRSLIESMYQRFHPEKLKELDRILDKYSGREADLYHALREKYSAQGAGPPQVHPGGPAPWGWGQAFWPQPPAPCLWAPHHWQQPPVQWQVQPQAQQQQQTPMPQLQDDPSQAQSPQQPEQAISKAPPPGGFVGANGEVPLQRRATRSRSRTQSRSRSRPGSHCSRSCSPGGGAAAMRVATVSPLTADDGPA